MRRGFEQENLFTLSKHATEFKNKVKKKKQRTLFLGNCWPAVKLIEAILVRNKTLNCALLF